MVESNKMKLSFTNLDIVIIIIVVIIFLYYHYYYIIIILSLLLLLLVVVVVVVLFLSSLSLLLLLLLLSLLSSLLSLSLLLLLSYYLFRFACTSLSIFSLLEICIKVPWKLNNSYVVPFFMENNVLKASHLKHFKICTASDKQ